MFPKFLRGVVSLIIAHTDDDAIMHSTTALVKRESRPKEERGGVHFNFLGEFRSCGLGKAFKCCIPTLAMHLS
jgi:hypothetical protein